ncbi:hypothetical protein KUTeg_005580, partial [Tegillarca granosa]
MSVLQTYEETTTLKEMAENEVLVSSTSSKTDKKKRERLISRSSTSSFDSQNSFSIFTDRDGSSSAREGTSGSGRLSLDSQLHVNKKQTRLFDRKEESDSPSPTLSQTNFPYNTSYWTDDHLNSLGISVKLSSVLTPDNIINTGWKSLGKYTCITDIFQTNLETLRSELTSVDFLPGLQWVVDSMEISDAFFTHRTIWSLALASMVCVLTVTLIQFKDAYFSYPTITDMTVDVAKELPFPAVTVCNLSPYINFSDPNYFHLQEDGVDGFLQNHSFAMSDMFVVCAFKGMMVNCFDYFRSKVTSWGICYTFNDPGLAEPIKTRHTGSTTSLTMYLKIDQANYVFGENMAAGMKKISQTQRMLRKRRRLHDKAKQTDKQEHWAIFRKYQNKCNNYVRTAKSRFHEKISTKLDSDNLQTKDWWKTIKLLTGATSKSHTIPPLIENDRIYDENKDRIVLHNPDEEPNVRDDGFLASPGFATYAAVRMVKNTHSKHLVILTVYIQRDLLYENPLKNHGNYSLFACMKECKLTYILNKCKCRMYFDEVDKRICSWKEYMYCYKPTRDKFEIDIAGQSNCSCPLPCEDTEYQTQISSTYFPSDINSVLLSQLGFMDLRKDYLEVRVFYDSLRYTTVQQVPKYTSSDIVANLGGQLGIFIGASFLTLTEIAEFIICFLYALIKAKFARYFIRPNVDFNFEDTSTAAIYN